MYMRRFKLLKDLPWAKAGSVWHLYKGRYGEEMLIETSNQFKIMGKVPYTIKTIDDWFMEIESDQPVNGEPYYYVNGMFGVNKRFWAGTEQDILCYRKANYFKSREAANKVYGKVMESIVEFRSEVAD